VESVETRVYSAIIAMEFSSRDSLFTGCANVVTARQHALECDVWKRWAYSINYVFTIVE